MPADSESAGAALSRRAFLAPLALAQFICSFAGSNMNVMINDISEDAAFLLPADTEHPVAP